MHKSTYVRMEYLVNYYEKYLLKEKGQVRVLDVGSYDVNGSYREIFNKPKYSYTGLDVCPGPNVDIVPQEPYSWKEIADDAYDVVISGQAFEHIEFPWLTIREISRVLHPSGFCVITAPNSMGEHKYPTDCYRYFSDGLAALAKWAGLKVLHVSVAGIPDIDVPKEWDHVANDAYLVAQKEPAVSGQIPQPFIYERRIRNGTTAKVTYRTLQDALDKVCRYGEDIRPVILFGAGETGVKAAEILGDKVAYFVDNDTAKIGKTCCNKEIISYEQYLDIADKYHTIITAKEEFALEIEKQLQEQNIEGHVLFIKSV